MKIFHESDLGGEKKRIKVRIIFSEIFAIFENSGIRGKIQRTIILILKLNGPRN